MAILQSSHAKGLKQTAVAAAAGLVVTEHFTYSASALAAGDIIELGVLPAGARLVDATLVVDDLDSNATPTITLDVGLMSGSVGSTDGARTCGAELFAANADARTGGVARMSVRGGFRLAPVEADRSVGVKVTAAAATAQAGVVTLLLSYVQ